MFAPLFLIFVAATVTAQIHDPLNSLCARHYSKSLVVGNTFVVDGGEYIDAASFVNGTGEALYNSAGINRYQNEHLWTLDLSRSFTTNRPPWRTVQKPRNPQYFFNGVAPALWSSNTTLHSFGGYLSWLLAPPPGRLVGAPFIVDNVLRLPDQRLVAYDVGTKQWDDRIIDPSLPQVAWAASTTTPHHGFMVGGVEVTTSAPDLSEEFPWMVRDTWSSSMAIYDFETDEWGVEELPGGIGENVDGMLVSIETVGEGGVLVFLGGERRGEDVFLPNRPDIDTVWVYDIAGKRWFEQKTAGGPPPGRSESCAVVVSAPDGSSHQIFVFAGQDTRREMVLDMWVLTLPAFQWVQVDLGEAGYVDRWPVGGHSCSSAGGMVLITGGEKNVSTTGEYAVKCDEGAPVGVFVTGTFRFEEEWNPEMMEAPPRVHKDIIDIVGGDEEGGATLTAPRHGWTDVSLAAVWAATPDEPGTTSPSPNPDTPPNGGEKDDNPSEEEGGISPGAIGGIVGGVVALIAVLVAAWWCLRRRRQRQSSAAPPPAPTVELHPAYINEKSNAMNAHETGGGEIAEMAVMPVEMGVEPAEMPGGGVGHGVKDKGPQWAVQEQERGVASYHQPEGAEYYAQDTTVQSNGHETYHAHEGQNGTWGSGGGEWSTYQSSTEPGYDQQQQTSTQQDPWTQPPQLPQSAPVRRKPVGGY